MQFIPRPAIGLLLLCAKLVALSASAEDSRDPPTPKAVVQQRPTLAALKATGLERSRFKTFRFNDVADASDRQSADSAAAEAPQADLSTFGSIVQPLLEQNCIDCHGPDTTEGNIRIDTLDPDLVMGADTDWWSEIFAVITKAEMPPPGESNLADQDRQQLVDWLSAQLHTASIARRRTGGHSTFRRMTRYEYNFALQDLLGLPWDFASDLPPEAHSEEGFQNSSELLHLSVAQFETYHRIARNALRRATVMGDKPPTRYWNITMKDAAQREWSKQDNKIRKLEKELKDDPEKLAVELEKLKSSFHAPRGAAYYKNLSTGRTAKAEWNYRGARFAFAPTDQSVPIPDADDWVAILPNGSNPRLTVELGNQ